MHPTQRRKGFARAATVVFVALAALLQWYGHQGGLLKTPDSCSYLAATKSFEGYRYFTPLFPIVLSVFGEYWEWVQLLLLIPICILINDRIKHIIKDPAIALICLCSIVLSVQLLMIGVFLWSELLFLLLLLLFVRSIDTNLIVAIIVGFFLCLQRNAGLFFVIGAAIYLWDIRRSLMLLLLSSSGLVAWNIYAGIAGEHEYFLSMFHNMTVLMTELMHVIAPITGLFLFVVIGGLFYFLKHDEKTKPLSILTITYVICMSLIFRFEAYDADRYISIVVPFFMILVFRALEIALPKQTSTRRTVLMILIVCWLAYPLSRTVKNAIQWHNVSFTSYFCAIQ